MTPITRRQLLQSIGGACLAPYCPPLYATAKILRTSVGQAPLLGATHPSTEIWGYDGGIPGPELRIRQGERFRVTVENSLPEPTTVHWHGLRVPNAMDGVPGLTQAPIQPGESFTYDFIPPDAGTFWYHSHFRSSEQVGRGLSGALIVEEHSPLPVHRDVVWVLDDWRLNRQGAIAPFRNAHDLSHAGRLGNVVTINGRPPAPLTVRTNERIRLRLINAANARIFALRFDDHIPTIIAMDGQPVAPHAPGDGLVILGPAMRIDVLLDCVGQPGSRAAITDLFYQRHAYQLTELSYADDVGVTPLSDSVPTALSANPLPEPDLANATRHEIALEGGAMGRMGGTMFNGKWVTLSDLMKHGLIWSMGGQARKQNDFTAPLITAAIGTTHILSLRNMTAFPHPMHLHGHHFRVLSRNGTRTTHQEWQDTVLVMPREQVEVAFKADSPGDWLFHCHVLEHVAAGMGALIRVA